MKHSSIVLIAALVTLTALLTACVDFSSGPSPETSEHAQFAVSAAPKLIVMVGNGRVDLSVGDAGEVVITAEIRDAEDVTYETSIERNVVTVGAETTGEGRPDVRLVVPADATYDITTGNGRVDAVGVVGPGKIVTDNGRVDVHGVTTTLAVTTGNGAVSVIDSEGVFDLVSGNGAISVEQAKGSFNLVSGNGTIDFKGELPPGSESSMASGNGSITVELTGAANVTLDLDTDDGRVRSELPTTIDFESDEELRGVVGDGSARLEADTGNGDITVR